VSPPPSSPSLAPFKQRESRDPFETSFFLSRWPRLIVAMSNDDDGIVSTSSSSGDNNNARVDPHDVACAVHLLTHHPLKGLQRKKSWSEAKVAESTTPEGLVDVLEFVSKLCDLPSCFDQHNKRFTSCTCLSQLDYDDLEEVAAMICKFFISSYFFYFTLL
jgi:hypothetical protein